MTLRQPIVTVCGHVDHGKTSLLDCFRGSGVQATEAGGITQRISFTKYPQEQLLKSCPLIQKAGITLDIPGFLFIDTPGHAAFTNLRKRGGALADLAIVVVSIKEGIKPQTAEVLQLLKTHKTPFVIALNKVDTISGWKPHPLVRESVDVQAIHVRQEYDICLLQFQASLEEHGFMSAPYWEVSDFTKHVALVPCSARTKEGISELLFVLAGLCQKFLKERLTLNEAAKGVILEVKKNKNQEWAEAILYDGTLDEGDEVVIASFGEPIVAKVRTIAEIVPLSHHYRTASSITAATGAKVQFTASAAILPGMPFQEVKGDMQEIVAGFKKEVGGIMALDSLGIIAKADSLGSLEALLVLLRQERIQVLHAGIGLIGKGDCAQAKANLERAPDNAVIVGFNVGLESDVVVPSGVKVITHEVVYKLIEDVAKWRKERQDALLKERLLGLATICKVEILSQHVFRNSNPAIFGVRVVGGILKEGIHLIDVQGNEMGRVKGVQHEKKAVKEAREGNEVALSLSGANFERQLAGKQYLYASLLPGHVKALKKAKDLLSASELQVVQEVMQILGLSV
ncbi:translation initiation factor IF-2 [Candidatus Pacearchaeota archaeon]|nr:translation initiation factor IF-2 [Candidatus Pacearchaeota archaeon]